MIQLLLILWSLWTTPTLAATFTAASCSLAGVQNAITSASARSGDCTPRFRASSFGSTWIWPRGSSRYSTAQGWASQSSSS